MPNIDSVEIIYCENNEKEGFPFISGQTTIGWKSWIDGIPYGDFVYLPEKASKKTLVDTINLQLKQMLCLLNQLKEDGAK